MKNSESTGKMKLVYAVDKVSYNNKDHIGVVKKVAAQMKQFEGAQVQSSLCQYVWEGGYPQIQIEPDTDILYFRRIEPSLKFCLKLRELKKQNPELCVIMEIPTYPFEGEENTGSIGLKRRINRIVGEFLMRYFIDRIVLFGQKERILSLYHIPVIHVSNGADFDVITKRQPWVEKKKNEIHLIAVLGCYFWHGYERLIKGMANYYKSDNLKEQVILHVVGDGTCLEDYKNLAKETGLLNSKVYFYGRKNGQELDELYDKAGREDKKICFVLWSIIGKGKRRC